MTVVMGPVIRGVMRVVTLRREKPSAAGAAAVITSSWVAEAAMSLSTCEPRWCARRGPE
jgi:hypothetical protein